MKDEQLLEMALGYVKHSNDHFREPYLDVMVNLIDLLQTIRIIQNIMNQRKQNENKS